MLKNLDRFSAQERALMDKALAFATHQHRNQKRAGGDTAYIVHPVAVAQALADEFGADAETVVAGLLHDTVEDTGASLDEIEKEFGPAIRFLVDGVTDYGQNDGNPHIANKLERAQDSKLKALRYAKQDPRVLLVKIADRTNNLKDILELSPFSPRGQIGYAYDTLGFHVLQAQKLGLEKQARQLEMICDAIISKWEGGLPAPFRHGKRAPRYS
jgi:GTP diphosphokinase / guanosine-3',5'-bis(diphosphate) 3'-diphosphatase